MPDMYVFFKAKAQMILFKSLHALVSCLVKYLCTAVMLNSLKRASQIKKHSLPLILFFND